MADLQSKYDALSTPKTPKVLEVDDSNKHIEIAREELAIARDKFKWQCVRENMLEALAYAPPLQAPNTDFESSAEKIVEAGKCIVERREYLNSVLRSLDAIKSEAIEGKETCEKKLHLVKNNEKGKQARKQAPSYSTASDLKNETNHLKTETSFQKQEIARLRQEKAQMTAKLELAKRLKDEKMALLSKLENEVGTLPPSSSTTTSETNETTSLAQKRADEMAELLSMKQEATATTEWFQSMLSLCHKIGGVKVMSFNNVTSGNDDDDGSSTQLEVEFSLWDIHKLVIVLGKKHDKDDEENDRDVIVDARLTTNFDTITFKESQLIKKRKAEENDLKSQQDDDKETWKNDIISGYLKSDGHLNMKDLIQLSQKLPPRNDVQWLIRECLARIAVWPERCSHFQQLRDDKKFIVNSSDRGCLVTLPVGVIVSLRLSPDYPRSTGAVVVESLTGVQEWNDKELKVLRDELNKTQWDTMESFFDVLEARLSQMSLLQSKKSKK